MFGWWSYPVHLALKKAVAVRLVEFCASVALKKAVADFVMLCQQ